MDANGSPDGRPRSWIQGPWIPVLAGVAAALVALPLLSGELGSLGGDNAEYVLLAKALRAGEGYVSTWGAGPPHAHTLYPPGLPLLLVPFVGGAPGSFLAAHVVVALCGALAAGLLCALFRRRGLPPFAAAGCAVAPALSLHWLRCAGDLLSELPALAAVAGALLLLEPGDPATRDHDRAPLSRRAVIGAAACAVAAFAFRTASLAVVLPVLVALAAGPRIPRRAGRIAAVGAALLVGAWFAYGHFAADAGGTYASVLELSDDGRSLPARAWGRLADVYLGGVPAFLFPRDGTVWTVLGHALWAAAAAGLAAGLWFRRTRAVTEGFFVLHLGMVCAWTFDDPRFALPLAPLLAAFALEGVLLGLRRVNAPAKGAALALSILGVAAVLPNAEVWLRVGLPRSRRATPRVPGLESLPAVPDAAGFVETWRWDDEAFAGLAPGITAYVLATDLVRGDDTLPVGVVLTHNHRVTALLAGRPCLQVPAGLSPTEVGEVVRGSDVALVLVPTAAPFIDRHSITLRTWWEAGHPGAVVVARVPGGAVVLRSIE